jgi:hypothetical protein
MADKVTPKMRIVLEALGTYENIIHRGTTPGEVAQSGGSRSVLYEAVKKGWASTYPEKIKGVPLYYRTDDGTEALNNSTPEGV